MAQRESRSSNTRDDSDYDTGSRSSQIGLSHTSSSNNVSRAVNRRGKKTQSPVARPGSYPQASSPSGSLVGDVYGDLPTMRTLYRYLKWPLLIYMLWLITTWSVTYCAKKAAWQIEQAVRPVCEVPIINNYIPLCHWSTGTPPKSLNLSKPTSSQEQLSGVMIPAGQNRGLAGEMIDREHAVRNLRLRVSASDLQRKKEIVEQFDTLIYRTKDAARGLSRFAAKVGKSVDAVITIDEYSVKKLEGVANRQSQPPSLPQTVFKALRPFSAFTSEVSLTEEQMKKEFLYITLRMAKELEPLNREAFDLYSSLEVIQMTLDRIAELSLDEFGDLPRMELLAALWTQLAHADDYAEYQSHKKLLEDLMAFYNAAGETMKNTISALNRVDAELDEFRDAHAKPGLVLKDYPIELTIGMLRSSIRRLQQGRETMDGVGLRPAIG